MPADRGFRAVVEKSGRWAHRAEGGEVHGDEEVVLEARDAIAVGDDARERADRFAVAVSSTASSA